MGKNEILDKLRDSIVKQDINGTVEATKAALAAGISAVEAIDGGLAVG